jgi:hypothetical protein
MAPGPGWTERGRPAHGYFTKRLAEDWFEVGLLTSHTDHGRIIFRAEDVIDLLAQ